MVWVGDVTQAWFVIENIVGFSCMERAVKISFFVEMNSFRSELQCDFMFWRKKIKKPLTTCRCISGKLQNGCGWLEICY